jgi:hypothetical protein
VSRTWSTTTKAQREYLREFSRPRLDHYFVGLAVTVIAVVVFGVAAKVFGI